MRVEGGGIKSGVFIFGLRKELLSLPSGENCAWLDSMVSWEFGDGSGEVASDEEASSR
jgi:hypothetical protein